MDIYKVYLDLPPKILRPRAANGFKSPGAPHYRAHLGSPDGEIIAEHTPTPFFDAARVLLARGLTGTIELWDTERSYPRMSGDIAAMAKLTVLETDREGPRFALYKPFPGRRYDSPAANKGSEGSKWLPI